MLNMIKMDLYRMFHMKSFYIVWMVLAAGILFTTYMSRLDVETFKDMTQEERSVSAAEEETVQEGTDQVNFGMDVTLPTRPGDQVTLLDLVYANFRGKFVVLFFLIFAVLYSSADIGSGYIKNIGGQVRDRSALVLSRAAVLLVYTLLSMILYLVIQGICQRMVFGYFVLGESGRFWNYVGVQTALHCALVLIAMAIAVIVKYNVISMTVSILLTMNMLVIFYSALDKALAKLGLEDFHIIEHTVTGKMSLLSMNAGTKESLLALLTASVFGIVAAAVSAAVFRQRDI